MGYDKNRFINNIYDLAKKQQLKIGELESACGVSIGYLARLRQGENNASPGAEFLMAVADQLSVSVDGLLSVDFTKATDSEVKLLKYMEKLIRETESRKLIWQEDFMAYLDSFLLIPMARRRIRFIPLSQPAASNLPLLIIPCSIRTLRI